MRQWIHKAGIQRWNSICDASSSAIMCILLLSWSHHQTWRKRPLKNSYETIWMLNECSIYFELNSSTWLNITYWMNWFFTQHHCHVDVRVILSSRFYILIIENRYTFEWKPTIVSNVFIPLEDINHFTHIV